MSSLLFGGLGGIQIDDSVWIVCSESKPHVPPSRRRESYRFVVRNVETPITYVC